MTERPAHTLHVLRVFCGENGSHGNPLGVFLNGPDIRPEKRQRIATDLAFSETVFVDEAASGRVRIFTPAAELPFAGHPMVGTAWLLAREGHDPSELCPPAGRVPVEVGSEGAAIAARPEWAPPFEWKEIASPAEVEALPGPPAGHDLIGLYAWSGETTIRARVFPTRFGLAEDEATGAAAIQLGAELGRPLTIHQGVGSVIDVRPREDGYVEISGRVTLDEVRPYPAG